MVHARITHGLNGPYLPPLHIVYSLALVLVGCTWLDHARPIHGLNGLYLHSPSPCATFYLGCVSDTHKP